MYEGNPVDLRMEKIISADGIFDEATRQCRVEKYDPEEDYIYLELKEDELTVISLDAKYRCYISTRTELLYCTGVVKERYCRDGVSLIDESLRSVFLYRRRAKVRACPRPWRLLTIPECAFWNFR